MRVLDTLASRRRFDGVITIEDMTHVRHAPAQARRAHVAPPRGAARRAAPARCVLVEDTLEHLKAARSLGMRTVWMQR